MPHLLVDMAKAKTDLLLVPDLSTSWFLPTRCKTLKNHSVMPSLFVVELHHVSGDASLIKLLPAALW